MTAIAPYFPTQAPKLKALINVGRITRICYNFDTHGTTDSPKNQHCDRIRKAYPFITFKNAYAPICRERTVKISEEIDNIKEAMCITRDGIHAMMKQVKPGMYEKVQPSLFAKIDLKLLVARMFLCLVLKNGQRAKSLTTTRFQMAIITIFESENLRGEKLKETTSRVRVSAADRNPL